MKINRPKFQDPSSGRNVNEMTIKLEQKLCSYQQHLIQLNSDKQENSQCSDCYLKDNQVILTREQDDNRYTLEILHLSLFQSQLSY